MFCRGESTSGRCGVGVDLGTEILLGDVLDGGGVGIPGVVDDHVQTPGLLNSDPNRVTGCTRVGDIESDSAGSWRARPAPPACRRAKRTPPGKRIVGRGSAACQTSRVSVTILECEASLEEVAEDYGLGIDVVRWAQSYELSQRAAA
jgi:hypothetical protein